MVESVLDEAGKKDAKEMKQLCRRNPSRALRKDVTFKDYDIQNNEDLELMLVLQK